MDSVTHFEIPSDNQDRAQAFYEQAFGWKVQSSPIPNWDYRMAMTDAMDEKGNHTTLGTINGALNKRTSPDNAPLLVVTVESMEEALKKIEAAGGAIVATPTPAGNYGTFAKFKDTEGNVLGVWQNLKA
jgi:uncharacterized protein